MTDYPTNNSMTTLQKSFIIIMFIITFCVCLAYFIFSAPGYQVKASILVQKSDLGIKQIDDVLIFNNPEISNTVQKLKSNYLLEKTLQKLNYHYSPNSEEFAKIQKNLFVRQIPPSNVIQITFSYHNINEAVQIVNTLVETLMQEDIKERREKVRRALESIQTALNMVQAEYLQPNFTAPKINDNLINVYIKEINDDLYKTKQHLLELQSNLTQNQIDIIKETLAPIYFERYKARMAVAEKKLVQALIAGGWNDRNVQNQLKNIWREKVKIAATFKERLNMRLDIPISIINEICDYEVRCFDLQIRKQELISLKQTVPVNISRPPLSLQLNKPYESLKELEMALMEKQAILQSLSDLTLSKITWIDKAFPQKPIFRSNILLTFGLSLGAGLFIAFITGLFFMEYNAYRKRM